MPMPEIRHDSASVDAVAEADKYNGSGPSKKNKFRRKSFKRRIRKLFGFRSKRARKNKSKDGEIMIPGHSESAAKSHDEAYTPASSFDDTKKSVVSSAPSLVSTTFDSMGNNTPADDEIMEASFRIVLLLLDPKTRRFELLNLDFESSQISVSEVLKQSFGSISAESLQKVTYCGLMGSDGVHRRGAELLSSFCTGNDILIGIPEKIRAYKMFQLASPILADKNIFKMISDSGANTTPWKKNTSTKSKATKKANDEMEESSFRIALLLLDPETRRFEIFNLDFESSQISVSEALKQSSGSIGSLQKITYSGLMGSDGVHRSGAELLSSFCKGNDILIGIPNNTSADKMFQLASPILEDEKIAKMISDSGADSAPWQNKLEASSTPVPRRQESKQRELPIMEPTSNKSSLGQPAMENKTGGSRHVFITTIEILLGLLLIYQYFVNAGYVAVPAVTGGDPTPPVPILEYGNQNREQMYSCIQTCIDNGCFLFGEDTPIGGGKLVR